MQKIYFLLVLLTISLFIFGQNDSIQMDSTVNVYVYGQITDGIDRELVYWKNGTLCHIPNSKPLTENERAGLTIENGDIYSYRYKTEYSSCCYDPYIDTISVYKNGKKMYSYRGYNGYFKESYCRVSSMAVLNGNVYLGLEKRREYDNEHPTYYLIKNDKIDQRQKGYGKYISVENGLLCYSEDSYLYYNSNDYTAKGYVIGGQYFTFDGKLCDKYIFEGMRVSHKNVFLGGYDKNTPKYSRKMKFIQRNNNDSIPLPANIKWAEDFAYIISRYIFAICYSTDSHPFVANVITGNVIELPDDEMKPIRLVSYGRCLYILCYEQTGALKYYYLCMYDISKSNITYYKLPNCSSAWDIHVEKK